MTPTHPSPEAMEVALRCINKLPLRAMLDGRATNATGVIAAEIDAFARARVEEENRACEAVIVDAIEHAQRRQDRERPQASSSPGARERMRMWGLRLDSLRDVQGAISARRGRG